MKVCYLLWPTVLFLTPLSKGHKATAFLEHSGVFYYPVDAPGTYTYACVTFSKPNERQAPGRLADEISMSWSMYIEPGANKVSSPSITTLSEPSATQGETPSGQELSKLCGSCPVRWIVCGSKIRKKKREEVIKRSARMFMCFSEAWLAKKCGRLCAIRSLRYCWSLFYRWTQLTFTVMTMAWSMPLSLVAITDSPVMYVISGRSGTGAVTR